MNKAVNKSYESTISTTATTGTQQFSDTMENNVKYMNLNFVDNSESSSQVKDVPLDYQKLQTLAFDAPKLTKPPPSKILPANIAFGGKHEFVRPKPETVLKEKTLTEMGFKCNEIEGWENIVQPPKENLYKLLKNMIDNHIKPNVQIRIGGVTFNCHMMVLQCYSDFFMECNNEVLIQLPEEKITPGAFMMVYDWMLAEEPLVQREGILELFNAANFLRIKDLINQCWLCLDDDVRFREDTAFLLYLEARSYGLESLEQLMLTRICKFFLTLVASKEFLDLNGKEICTLLTSNTIGVNSEIEIFMAVVRWLSHNWEQREADMLSVVKCVRFSLMPPWFLVTLNKTTECEEIDRIASHPEVKKMINDGISFTTTQLYYGENREEFLHFLERYQLVAPMQRQWVFDKDCSYHHRLECPNMQYVTYKSFLEYLEMIQSIGREYWHSLEMAKSEKNLQCCVRSDSRKANDKNVAAVFTRKISRDQGIQVAESVRHRKKFVEDGSNKTSHTQMYKGEQFEALTSSSDISDYSQLHNCKLEKADQHARPQQPHQHEQQQHYHNQRLEPVSRSVRRVSNKFRKSFKNRIHKMDQKLTGKQHDAECQLQQQQQQQQQQKQQKHKSHTKYKEVGKRDTRDTLSNCLQIQHQHNVGKGGGDGNGDLLTIGDGAQLPLTESSSLLLTLKPSAQQSSDRLEDSIIQLLKGSISTCSLVDFNLITNKKIIIFGGIDPYCQHCMRQVANPPAEPVSRRGMLQSESSVTCQPTAELENSSPGGVVGAGRMVGMSASSEIENYGDQVIFCDASNLQWRHLTRIPFGSRHHHTAVVCNGLIYIVGGTRTALGCTKKSVFEKSVWSFNPKTLKWAIECTLPEARRDFAVIAIDNDCERCPRSQDTNKLLGIGFFIIGGEGINGVALDTVWFYDVLRKIWIKKASLNVGRYGFASTMVNNEIWIAGGIINDKISTTVGGGGGGGGDGDGSTMKTTADVITDSMEYYSLKCIEGVAAEDAVGAASVPCAFCDAEGGGQWIKSRLYLRVPRLFGKFCKISSTQLYLVGGIGFSKDDFLTSLASVDYFDFRALRWQYCGDINVARHGHDVAVLNELIIVIGGVSTIKKCTLTKVDAFCTRTRKPLKDIPELPWALSGCATAVLD